MSRDTSPEAERVLRERMRRTSPGQRILEGLTASVGARAVMRAGIRRRHPDYTHDDVEEALAGLLWGEELYRRVRGRPAPKP
jgi:hypothetical protein